jgi:hypothetical protein
VLLWEDDMMMCGNANNGTLATVFASIDDANARASDWTGLRFGFGGNGACVRAGMRACMYVCVCARVCVCGVVWWWCVCMCA